MREYQQLKNRLAGPDGERLHAWLTTLLFLSQLLPQRFSYILTAVWALPWLLLAGPLKLKSAFRKYPILWLLIALFLVQALGLIYTEEFRAGRIALEQRLSLLLFPLILFSVKTLATKHLNRIFELFTYGWLLLSILSLIMTLRHNYEVLGELNGDSYWLFSYHNLAQPIGFTATMAALYVGFCMLWLLQKLLTEWTSLVQWRKVLFLLILIYFIAYQVLLSSRTIQVTVLLLLYVGTLLWLYRNRSKIIAFVASVVIPLVFLGMLYSHKVAWDRLADAFKFGQKMEETQFGGYQLRLEIWTSAWEVIRKQPIIGVGTGDAWDAIVDQHQKGGFTEGVEKRFHAHNQYLQDWMTLGILGLLILLANFFIPLLKAIKHQHHLYMAFMILIICACLTDVMISFYRGIFFFALTNALLLHNMKSKKKELL